MSKPCVFHCLDVKMAKEYTGTCEEYTGYVKKPGFCHNLKQMFTCKSGDWGTTFREWGVLQLYVAVVVAITVALIDALTNNSPNMFAIAWRCALQIVFAYIFAHLAWFGVVRKEGCFCCIVACCECQPLLLLWGVLMMCWAVASIASVLATVGTCMLCWINFGLQCIYAIILFYMGYACLFFAQRMLWMQTGKELIPPRAEVQGP
ncbi:unnamed protein product [Effrenium voratum]|nr:unnamed protein product [Effrenium voratum]